MDQREICNLQSIYFFKNYKSEQILLVYNLDSFYVEN